MGEKWKPPGYRETTEQNPAQVPPRPSQATKVEPSPLADLTGETDEFGPMSLGSPAPISGYLRPGTRLGGRYETIRPIAAGGMAEVHLARALGIHGFEKLVVLKRILPELADDPYYIEMFLGEARVAAMLDHPNVAQAFDLGMEGTDYYYVMEFLDGVNLVRILLTSRDQGHSLPIPACVAIGIGVAAGLQHAHDATDLHGRPQQIVHRDVSPANVLITREGHVKLVDFGIAKAVTQTSVTKAGTRKGKTAYMSPEQLMGVPIDHRSDLFALGILLYESTTMTRLFRGPNEMSVINQILYAEVPPPSSRDPHYPPDLERIVMRCLERDPQARYQHAREIRNDLESYAARAGIMVSPSTLAQVMTALFGSDKTRVYVEDEG